jgi:hypothetical protein
MHRLALLLAGAASLSLGCSSVTRVARPPPAARLQELNETAEGNSALVLLLPPGHRPGAALPPVSEVNLAWPAAESAAGLVVGREQTQWTEVDPGGNTRPRSAPTEALRAVVIVNHGRGTAEGIFLGLLGGALLGGGLSLRDFSSCNEICFTNNLIITAGLSAAGAVVGGFIGSARGDRTTFEFAGPK